MIKNKKFVIVWHYWWMYHKYWEYESFTGTEKQANDRGREKKCEDEEQFRRVAYKVIEIKKTDDVTLENITLKLKLNDALWIGKIYKCLFFLTTLLYIIYFIFK